MSCVGNLEALSLHFWEGFIVCHFGNNLGNIWSKMPLNFIDGGLGIFNRIVQDCGYKDVWSITAPSLARMDATAKG